MTKPVFCLAGTAALLGMMGCALFTPGGTPAPTPAAEQATVAAPTEPAAAASERLEVVLAPNPSQETLTDVFSSNPRTGEVIYLISLENVDDRHYHGQELHHGNLYIVLRGQGTQGSEETPPSELWRYDSGGQPTLLFSAPSIDFRVAPNELHIALTYAVATEAGNELHFAFLDQAGKLAYELNTGLLNPSYSVGPLDWSPGASEFWAALQAGPKPMALLRVSADSWAIRLYDLTALQLWHEFALNTETARLAFSDHPAMVDADSVTQFAQSQTPVTLWVVDLETHQQQTIATTIARSFAPKWLDARTLEYNHPEEEGRVFVIVE